MPKNVERTRYVIANWKMNLNLADITNWLEIFHSKLRNKPAKTNPATKIILAPSFPYLGIMSELTKNSNFELAAQDVSLFEKGAHTGHTGIFQIKDFCKYALIGHSELMESFAVSLKKRDLCLEQGLMPIMCVAKIEDMASAYKTETLLTWEDPATISINGVNRSKDPEEIALDLSRCRENLPKDASLIYGGSVNRKNIEQLSAIPQLDGVLVGNASNDPEHFAELVSKF